MNAFNGHHHTSTAGHGAGGAHSVPYTEDDFPTWREVADAVWLAAQRAAKEPGRSQDAPPEEEPAEPPAPAQNDRPFPEHTHDGPKKDRSDSGDRARSEAPGAGDALLPPEENPEVSATEPAASATEPAGFDRDKFRALRRRSALPDQRAIARALRPFRQTVAHAHALELDEEATAHRAATDARWLPVCEPGRERAFDLTLLVDDSTAMMVHHPTARAFRSLVESLGVFRHVRVRYFDSDATTLDKMLAEAGGQARAPRNPAALLRGGEHRDVAIVLTDGVGIGWHSGAVQRWLAAWGPRCALCVIDLLPAQQWHRTGVLPRPAHLRTSGRVRPGLAAPNLSYTTRAAPRSGSTLLDHSPPPEAVPVPVLELRPERIQDWARFAVGGDDLRSPVLDASTFLPDTAEFAGEPHDLLDAEDAVLSAADRVRMFHSEASPTAFQLAVYLAAVPINLALIRALQERMLPGSEPAHITEVLCSGLLQRVDGSSGDAAAPDHVSLEYDEEVRAELLRAGRRTEFLQVLFTLADHLRPHRDWLDWLDEALVSPKEVLIPDRITQAGISFIVPVIAALKSLSGTYSALAQSVIKAFREIIADTDPEVLDRYGQTLGLIPVSPGNGSSPLAGEQAFRHAQSAAQARGSQGLKVGTSHQFQVPQQQENESPDGEKAPEPSSSPLSSVGGSVAAVHSMQPSDDDMRRPGEPPPIWGNVPPKNHSFVGREDLLRSLHSRLAEGSTTAVLPQALHGMGGVGKSQLAVEYVYRHQNDYDLVWWIPAERPGQVQQALIELAHRLRLPVGNEANTAVPAVIEALRLGRMYDNWLLVFDNAEAPEQVRRFFPTNGPGHILVTSRDSDWAQVSDSLEVDIFQRAESQDLLRTRGPELADADADQLAEALGDLPLAIEQAAVWLYETGMPVEEYLSLFREKASELMATTRPPHYEIPVAAAWNVSLERLSESNPAAMQLLQVCAFFASEPVSRKLFAGARNIPAPEELGLALGNPIQIRRAFRDISRYALARMNHRDDTLLLHRLVQRVLRDRMDPEVAKTARHCAHMLLANGDPHDPDSSSEWPRYSELLPHALASETMECADPWVRELVINLIVFLFRWGDHEESARLGQAAVEQWTERLGEDHPHTLSAANALADTLRYLGEHQRAYELGQRTHELMVQTRGEEDEETLVAAGSTAWDLRNRGQFWEALQIDKRIYETQLRLIGRDDPASLQASHVYGLGLRHTGQFEQAARLDKDTYERKIQVLGPDHPATLGTAFALALDYMEAGRYVDALRLQEEVLLASRNISGNTSTGTMAGILILSTIYRRAGRYQEARALSAEGLGLLRSRYKEEFHATVQAAICHAMDLRQTGDLDEALKLAEASANHYREIFGAAHPHVASAETNLAVVLRLHGRAAEAHRINERALPRLLDSLGEGHPSSIACAINLASDMFALGDVNGALEHDRATLDSCRNANLADEHPLVLICERNLALDQNALDTPEASARLASIEERYRHVYGPTHPATLATSRGMRANCDIFPMPI